MLRVWKNRTFATAAHTVAALHANGDREIEVIGSHVDADSPFLAACDRVVAEPVGSDGEYIDELMRTAVELGVDVVWPTARQSVVARAKPELRRLGIAVVSPAAETIDLLADKAATYAAAASLGGVVIPYHTVVETAADFALAYARIIESGETVCFKPVGGVGGEGFRIVTEAEVSFEELMRAPSPRVSLRTALRVMERAEPFAPLLVMPVLPGAEWSVDILARHGRVLAAVPRRKPVVGRRIELVESPELVSAASAVVERFSLDYLVNVQFREDAAGNPHLLEVNTRASGGLYQSCAAVGNLPYAALRLALGETVAPLEARLPVSLTPLGTVVALDRDSALV